MPWQPSDARRFTKKAKTAKQKRQFAHVSSSMLKRGASEGAAIRAANAAVGKSGKHSKRKQSKRKGSKRR